MIMIHFVVHQDYFVLKRAGAEYGLSLSWSLLVASCMAFVMLEASARLVDFSIHLLVASCMAFVMLEASARYVHFSIHLFSTVLLSWDELNLC